MNNKLPAARAVVCGVLSATCAALAVVSVPVAGTGAPLVTGGLALIFGVTAAVFFERVAHGRFSLLGAIMAVAIAVGAGGVLTAIGVLVWSHAPNEVLLRVVSESQHHYLEWTSQGIWLVGSLVVACSLSVAASGIIAGRLTRFVLAA
jgi:hypothetical protein